MGLGREKPIPVDVQGVILSILNIIFWVGIIIYMPFFMSCETLPEKSYKFKSGDMVRILVSETKGQIQARSKYAIAYYILYKDGSGKMQRDFFLERELGVWSKDES